MTLSKKAREASLPGEILQFSVLNVKYKMQEVTT